MQYLIDGYNLQHALGMAPRASGSSLEKARLRFIEWLSVELGPAAADVLVIFDSRQKNGDADLTHRNILMRFSHGQTADDLIEQIVRDEKSPTRLTVVSNDHRVLQAGRRRGCPAWTCGEFVDWLAERKTVKQKLETPNEKPDIIASDDIAEWLKKFGEERGG
ncbi:MAG: NYN domain-containing protein [Planctomycetes bacterium]|nr:NYN domain-containing protein [Planctomycetota bacterium]